MNKEYNPKPTENQKEAFKKIIEKVKKGEKVNIGEVMREVGYSDWTSKHPAKLTDSKGFKRLLNEKIDDKTIINRFAQILKEGSDRESIKAGKELLKLKNRYEEHNESEAPSLNVTVSSKE